MNFFIYFLLYSLAILELRVFILYFSLELYHPFFLFSIFFFFLPSVSGTDFMLVWNHLGLISSNQECLFVLKFSMKLLKFCEIHVKMSSLPIPWHCHLFLHYNIPPWPNLGCILNYLHETLILNRKRLCTDLFHCFQYEYLVNFEVVCPRVVMHEWMCLCRWLCFCVYDLCMCVCMHALKYRHLCPSRIITYKVEGLFKSSSLYFLCVLPHISRIFSKSKQFLQSQWIRLRQS